MTIDDQITAWALAQSEACKLALLEQRAAVMPLRPDEILSDNPYAPRRETIIRVVRPKARKVPDKTRDMVATLRAAAHMSEKLRVIEAFTMLADHFEREAKP